MTELSAEDRAALLVAWPWPQEAATTESGFSDVAAAVEQIVQRHIEAFRAEAVAAIRAGVSPAHPNSGYRDGFGRSAQIVEHLPT